MVTSFWLQSAMCNPAEEEQDDWRERCPAIFQSPAVSLDTGMRNSSFLTFPHWITYKRPGVFAEL